MVWKANGVRSPPAAVIVAWRDRLSDKYAHQLGEQLLWDENSEFDRSEDVAASADVSLRYTAAILDQRGPAGARFLAGASEPSGEVLNAAFSDAERWGFAGRFPQLLRGARYWLPFRRHLIIEEPNWRGNLGRYGALFQLRDELAAVRTIILETDPAAARWTVENMTPPPDVLAAAWQASDTISRLCAAAIDRHIPLWTAG